MKIDLNILIGKTLTGIEIGEHKEHMIFVVSESEQYQLYHAQDCCELVVIEDIEGDLNDLIGQPILQAEEASYCNEQPPKEYNTKNTSGAESFTWTFYKFATIKGYVTIRWYGESNGWYSERVSFMKLKV